MLTTWITEKHSIRVDQGESSGELPVVEIEVAEDGMGLLTIFVRQMAVDAPPVAVKFCGVESEPEFDRPPHHRPVYWNKEVAATQEP